MRAALLETVQSARAAVRKRISDRQEVPMARFLPNSNWVERQVSGLP